VVRYLTLLVCAVGLALSTPARAEDEPVLGNSYLPLYPTGDVYQVIVIGDKFAEGLEDGLSEAFRGDARAQIKPKVLELNALMRNEIADQTKVLDDALGREQPSVAVVMIGPQERTSIKGAKGKKLWIDSEEWRAEFTRQVDGVMKMLKRRKLAVYWVSLPNVRRDELNEDVQVLNEIIRERVYLNGLKYIDAYAGFADESGGFSVMGPDLAGKIRSLRDANGVGFTEAGNKKLAHFVERDFKRDLSQAKAERTIPLAGNEAEQAAINVTKAASKPLISSPGAAVRPQVAGITAGGEAAAPVLDGEQKADSGKINLAVAGAAGREEVVTLDLLRPAIPASVIALVNRKENAEKVTQLGDLLIDQISGGVMVMSSITPASDPNSLEVRRKLSPTQTPYFRVMVKGERIAPRAGRADDTAWPRSEPPVVAEPPAVAVPVKAGPAEAKPGAVAPKAKKPEPVGKP
jgi:uncharacterized protein